MSKKKTPLSFFAALYVPAVAILFLAALSAVYFRIPVGSLTRDMATLADIHPLTGALSNVGILLWCATAAVSLFTAAVIWERAEPRQVQFLVGFSCLTLVLLFDDFFMLHEYLAPVYLGLRERYLMLIYAAAASGLLIGFRKVILSSEYGLLGIALAFFAISVGVDRIHYSQNAWSWLFLAEDGAKFLGIAGWSGYFIRHSYIQLTKAVQVRQTGYTLAGLEDLAGYGYSEAEAGILSGSGAESCWSERKRAA
ncbi:MAG TPA: hypothetical protein VGK71_00010 [Nitrospirota bacterium]|jgi:hypothetical protein